MCVSLCECVCVCCSLVVQRTYLFWLLCLFPILLSIIPFALLVLMLLWLLLAWQSLADNEVMFKAKHCFGYYTHSQTDTNTQMQLVYTSSDDELIQSMAITFRYETTSAKKQHLQRVRRRTKCISKHWLKDVWYWGCCSWWSHGRTLLSLPWFKLFKDDICLSIQNHLIGLISSFSWLFSEKKIKLWLNLFACVCVKICKDICLWKYEYTFDLWRLLGKHKHFIYACKCGIQIIRLLSDIYPLKSTKCQCHCRSWPQVAFILANDFFFKMCQGRHVCSLKLKMKNRKYWEYQTNCGGKSWKDLTNNLRRRNLKRQRSWFECALKRTKIPSKNHTFEKIKGLMPS